MGSVNISETTVNLFFSKTAVVDIFGYCLKENTAQSTCLLLQPVLCLTRGILFKTSGNFLMQHICTFVVEENQSQQTKKGEITKKSYTNTITCLKFAFTVDYCQYLIPNGYILYKTDLGILTFDMAVFYGSQKPSTKQGLQQTIFQHKQLLPSVVLGQVDFSPSSIQSPSLPSHLRLLSFFHHSCGSHHIPTWGSYSFWPWLISQILCFSHFSF